MAAKRIVAIVGATGAQGGGLARAILADPASEFEVRALTRAPDADRGRALAERGATVVAADLDDAASLTRAFAGADAVFGVTNFWEHMSPERERRQAHAIAEAAKAAGVRHVIWSTLDDTRARVPLEDPRIPTLMGEFKVPHFDAKGESDRRFVELGVPTTFLNTTFYWDNLIHFGMGPRRAEDGGLDLVLPMGDKRLAGIAADDIGRVAYGILRAGDAYVGKTVSVAGDFVTGAEMAEKLGVALGERVRYVDVPIEVYRTFGFPGAEDIANMFWYYQTFEAEFCGARPLDATRALHPQLQTFDAWLAGHVAAIAATPAAAPAR
ncbi:NmrA/HSCARG family protein [Roseisolibacter sp. H3M3-2]|uniref:NmrA/HSCARG family protein n=1 Tax=Roseisolibacter sp. H3M3-2 TaxID=3031323 RepID=UPI0023DCB1E7|nr:NmrA/HSCARG family protein [Roseisolibacter sp. H3M3-2]MDF1504236.1 NmrA/HSCARG family protein [Roseisolibacter sp. H3M3-2]